ncbi:MAG: adenylate kinase family protein, partial [Methanosarcinales archaeon]
IKLSFLNEALMILAITGTPGTGKTSVCKALGLAVLDLNTVIEQRRFYTGIDTERGSFIADLEALKEYLSQEEKAVLIIESHLAHLLDPEVAIVLRANPTLLSTRLTQKGFPARKIAENVEAETLDIIIAEAVVLCGVVYEVDTSEKSIEEVASVVREIIDAEIEGGVSRTRKTLRDCYKPGSVDWTHLVNSVFGFND